MNTRQKFKRKVVEAIHGLPYDQIEVPAMQYPITIGRIMQAWCNKEGNGKDITCYEENSSDLTVFNDVAKILDSWKLTKENGQECDDSDQSDETIKKLLELLK